MVIENPSSTNEPEDEPIDETSPPEELQGTKLTSGDGRPASIFARVVVNLLMVIVLAITGYLAWQRLSGKSGSAVAAELPPIVAVEPASQINQPESNLEVGTIPFTNGIDPFEGGITRRVVIDTIIPTRPRVDVITYTVQTGDNLFDIAEKYGLKPETVLWGNFETLEDNPQMLSPGQVLNILPTDGTYYQWREGDQIEHIAGVFGVRPQAILEYSGNPFDLTALASGEGGIEPDTWVIVPGGKRAIKDWGPPVISRSNPASARYYGEGHCGSVYEGAYGSGAFIWPTTERFISGYNYTSIHTAIDIGGSLGNAIFAADSGVVVFSGWSNYGYGYMIVVDHGNGWQTAYAHLSSLSVGCGQSVFQGGVIGGLGSTGNSSGPHLHFELVFNGSKVNPLDYLN